MSFTEELKIDFTGKVSAAELDAREIVPVLHRDYLHASGEFSGVLPEADRRFADWDAAAILGFCSYMAMKASQREYGFLNYGDSFGERHRNWVNNEYDFAHGLFMLFLRTGERDVFRWAKLAARHQADVDIVHACPDPYYLGANAQHGIGHTGVSHQRIWPATWSWPIDHTFIGANGHTWSAGMLDAWCLTGDSRVMDAALMLGEHLTRYTAPRFTELGTHERTAGWSIKAILDLYRVTGDAKYLEAAAKIVRVALGKQNFDKGGAWPHKLPGDHAGGHEETFGNALFLIGTLISALREYYRLTGDPAVARSIVAAARWQAGNWNAAAMSFPYTASWDCKPYWALVSNLNMLVAPGIICGGVLSGDRKAREIACDVMAREIVSGFYPLPKYLAMRLVYNGEFIDDFVRFEQLYPGAKPYAFDAGEFLGRLRGKTTPFNVRGPERKEFEITLTAPESEVIVTRDFFEARRDLKSERRLVLAGPDGKTIAERKFDPEEKHREEKLRLSGRPGDRFKLVIDDDMTGCWNVVPAPGHRTGIRLRAGSRFRPAFPAKFYFTVPAGTREFSFWIRSENIGGFRVWAIRPDGTEAGSVSGMNLRGFPLQMPKRDVAGSRILRVTPAVVPIADEEWTLVVLAAGNVRIGGTSGVVPYLRIVPEKEGCKPEKGGN